MSYSVGFLIKTTDASNDSREGSDTENRVSQRAQFEGSASVVRNDDFDVVKIC